MSTGNADRDRLTPIREVEVSRDGLVRVRRVVCAVDCGAVVNGNIVQAQIEGAIIFGITAALYGAITLKDGDPGPPCGARRGRPHFRVGAAIFSPTLRVV